MSNIELQKALSNNYETNFGLLSKTQINTSLYYQWVGLISELFDEVKALYTDLCNINDIDRKEIDEKIYEMIKSIFDFIGEVNGYTLSHHDYLDTLLLYIMLSKKEKIPNEHFRLNVEKSIGRQIMVQNLKSQRVLEEEYLEKHDIRRMKNKLRRNKKRRIEQTSPLNSNDRNKKIDFSNFIVRTYAFKCTLNHETEQIKAQVDVVLKDGTIENRSIIAAYCSTCKCYFMLETDYQKLSELGVLLCQVISEEQFHEKGLFITDNGELKAESLLHQSGYNVMATKDLTSQQRQIILCRVVDNNLYTVNGICSHLDWLISRNMRVTNRDMSLAIAKWKEDRDFISTYKMDNSRPVGVKTIVRYEK